MREAEYNDVRALVDPEGDIYVHVGDLSEAIRRVAGKGGAAGLHHFSVEAIEMVAELVLDYGSEVCRSL